MDPLDRARCALVVLRHAIQVATDDKVLVPVDKRFRALAIALQHPEVVTAFEELELEEPGIAMTGRRLAKATAANCAAPPKPVDDHEEIQKLATVHPTDWKNEGPFLASFRLHIPSTADKYRAGYDRIFGKK